MTVTFRGLEPGGAAVGEAGPHLITVPFAAPGESAVVEVVRGGPRPEGRIVSLLRRSPQAVTPRCRHFGVCGGCQWQHLSYESQLESKTALLRDAIARALPAAADLVQPATGGDPWAYRDRLQATVSRRGDRLVIGFHAVGADLRVVNVRECPIQTPVNVEALDAVRSALAELGWPVFDVASGRGLLRGVIVQTAVATGEVLVVLSVSADLPNRMALVRRLLDRIPALRGLLLSRPSASPSPLGRLQLLWGREYIEDEVAGVRLRRYPTASVPPNPRALGSWVRAVAASLELQGTEVVFDAACEEGFMPVALSRQAARVIGVAPTREAMARAWANAAMNGVTSCVFYTRVPARVAAKLVDRGERLDAALLTARGQAAGSELIALLARAGVARLAVAGSSPALLVADLRAAAEVGYRVTAVRPVDLLPQTSRVHCVAALVRE